MVSVSDITDVLDSNVSSVEDMEGPNLEQLSNFEDDANQCEYNLSWGCHHISSFKCRCIDEINMDKLVTIVDESISQIGLFLEQNENLYKIELIGSQTFVTRIRRCGNLVHSFSSMSKLMLEVLHKRILLVKESFHCALQTVADEVCRNDERYNETSDIKCKADWTNCQKLKREIIETENLYDRIEGVKREFELRVKGQLERGSRGNNEFVVIDLDDGQEEREVLTDQRPENTTLNWPKIVSIAFVCVFFGGIVLVEAM